MFKRTLATCLRANSRLAVAKYPKSFNTSPFALAAKSHGVRFQSTKPMDKQELMLAFTCNKCSQRSSHVISKQAYTGGTVLVKCPGCENRHLIADHLKIFKDNKFTIEELMDVSKSTDDLVFDEIPERLKGVLGYYAKDAPASHKDESLDTDDEIKKIE